MLNITLYAKEENGGLRFDNSRELGMFLEENRGKKFIVTIKRETVRRTETQSAALHLYLHNLAKELNMAGITVQKFLKQAVELSWSKDSCKELIWRPIQEFLVNKKSTTNLDKVNDIDTIYDHLNDHLGRTFSLFVPWPSELTKPK